MSYERWSALYAWENGSVKWFRVMRDLFAIDPAVSNLWISCARSDASSDVTRNVVVGDHDRAFIHSGCDQKFSRMRQADGCDG